MKNKNMIKGLQVLGLIVAILIVGLVMLACSSGEDSKQDIVVI